MAVQTSTSTIRAMGNGAATVFSFAPIILLSNVDEMHVYEIDDDDNEVEITTGFTVSVSSFPGTGDVTFDTAPVDGTNLLFRRQVEITQLTRLFNQGAFDPQVIERALDKLTLIAADLKSVEEDRAADDEEINEIIQEYLRLNHTEVNAIIREYIEDNDIGSGGPGNVSAYAYLFTQSFTLAEDTSTQAIPTTGDGLIISILDETNAGGPIIQGFPFIVEWEGVLELQIDQAREIELILKTTHNLNGKTFTHPRSYKFNLVANTRFTVPLTVFNSHAVLRAGTYNIGGEEIVLTDADFLADTMISYEFEIIARRRSDDTRRGANVTNIELVNACQIAFQLRRAVSEGGGDGVDQTARDIATAALPKSGGVMTGTLILKGDPAANLEAATKQYVDSNAGGGGDGTDQTARDAAAAADRKAQAAQDTADRAEQLASSDSVTIVDALPAIIPDAGTAFILRDPVGERDEGIYIVKSHGGDYYEGAVVNSIDSIIAVQANLDNNPNGSVSELEWTLNGLHIYAEFHNSAFVGSPPANLYIEITHLDTAGGAIGAADELSSGDRANSRVTLARQSSFDRLGHYSYGNQLSGDTMTLWGGVDVGERLRFKVYTDAGYSTPLVSTGGKYYDLITEDKFPHQMALVRLAQGGAEDGQTLVWDDDNSVWAPADPAPTVLAGTRLPTTSDGSDKDFWVAGLDNGGTLSISENVEGAYVEIGRASYDKDAVASLQHLTRDVHITDLITTWSAVDNSDADLYWTVPINNAITLTDANFNNQGTSITIPSSVSPRTNYVFVRLPAATSVTPLRMRQGGNVAGSNVWALAADEGVTVPDNDAFQYWMAVINLQETAAETWVLEERETVDHTRFDGELGGRALEEARNDGRFSALEHLTRDLHINTDTPDWSDAADSEGDLFQVLDPGSAVTLTDANFNNNGSGIQIPDGQNADTLIYVRLPAAADHTIYRITFDDREPRGGNTWARVNGPDTSTYQYWFVYSVNNFGFSFVQLEKRSSLEDTTYTGSGAVPAGGTTAQALIKSSNADYAVAWGTVSGGDGGGSSTTTPTVLYEDATAHTWDHDGFREVTLSRAPAAGTVLQFTLVSSPTGLMSNTIYMPSDAFLALDVPDSGATGYNAGWPSPGNKVWLGVAPAAVDTAARITYSVGGNEWSHLTFCFIRRQSNTGMDVLYTFDGIDRSAVLKIEELPNGSAAGAGDGGGGSFTPSKTNIYDAVKEIFHPATNGPVSADDTNNELDVSAADSTARTAAAAAQATADAALPKAGGTMTGKIVLDGAPTANLHPATKAYADTISRVALAALPLAGGTMTGKIVLDGAPTANLHAATKAYVDANAGGGSATDATARMAAAAAQTTADAALSRSGGTMTGALTLRGAPTTDLQAATKKYVDDTVSDAVADSGGDDGGDGGAAGDFLELIGASSGPISLDANTVADTGIDLPADIPTGEVWAVRIGNERYDDLEFFLASEINSRDGTTVGATPLDPDTSAGRAAGVLIRGKRQGASQNDLLLLAKDTGASGHILIASTHQGLDPEVTLYRVNAGGGASAGGGGGSTELYTSPYDGTFPFEVDEAPASPLDVQLNVNIDDLYALIIIYGPQGQRHRGSDFIPTSTITTGTGDSDYTSLSHRLWGGRAYVDSGLGIRKKVGDNSVLQMQRGSSGDVDVYAIIGIPSTEAAGGGEGGEAEQFEVLDTLPSTNDYDTNNLIAVGEEFYKLAVTDDTEPNLFEGDVGRDVFNTTAGERWRGISNSQSPNGFSTDGEFTANPNNTLSLLLASSSRHIRVAMKRSVYEAAKGSAFNTNDHIAIKVTMADGTTTDEAVLAYYNQYVRRDTSGADTTYIIWQHRHASDNYNLYAEDAGNAIKIEFFTTSGDPPAATTTPLLTHAATLKHWIHWPTNDTPSADARAALNLAQANQARLDALDLHVDGDTEPLHTQTYDENTALLAPVAASAGNFAVSETFSNVLTDDLIVVDWRKCDHLNHHDEHVVPGSNTDAGRMYFYPKNFDTEEWDGEFLYGLERALQDNGSPDELNSWIVGSIVYSGSSLTFGLHLQQGGSRTNRNLKPRPGFSITIRVYRNSSVAATLETSSAPVKGVELGRLVGHNTNKLGEQPWTNLLTDVTTVDADGPGWSHWLSLPMLDYITLANGLGIILEMTRTGVSGQFSQIFIPWHAMGQWSGSAESNPMFGGSWKASGTSDNDRIEIRGRVASGRLDLQAACAGADATGTLHAYIAK